ncbi:MAG: cytochrome c oxidase assembly protein [Propionibacteriales bacterium]|nr:cytochrome c oxidase assembly protein [Propionibacteriales bacterium]
MKITMHQQARVTAATIGSIMVAFLVAVAGAAVTSLSPPIPGYLEADPATVIISGLLYVAAGCAALLTLSRLIRAVWLTPRPTRDELAEGSRSASGYAWRRTAPAAVLWCATSALTAIFNAGAAQGFPVAYVIADPFTFLSTVQTAQAWTLTALVAAVVAIVTLTPRRWGTQIVTTVLVLAAQLPVVVTAQVSVGVGHDFATDAAIIMTLALAVAVAAIWGAAGLEDTSSPGVVRGARMAAVGLLVAIGLRIAVAVFEMAGVGVWTHPYGIAMLGQLGTWLILLALTGTVALQRGLGPRLGALRLRVGAWVAVVSVGFWAALLNLVPPRFLEPQTIAENYLGFEIPPAPTFITALTPGRPNLLLGTTALAAIVVYALAFARLRRRGDHWPWHRLVCWCAGWLLVLAVSGSSAWALSSVAFSWHMGIHMVLSMLAPPLIVLGGVITLALRVLSASPQALPRLRSALLAVMEAPLVVRLTSPLVVWLIFVASFYVLYFSPLFGAAMRYHWAHQAMTFHFLIMGCLFYGTGIGVDRPVRDIPAVARLALVFAAMPFHAFFSIGVLSGTGIGEQFYRALDVSWIADLGQDQQLGGQVTWALGEMPMLIVVIALLAQWFAHDRRTARRADRQADRDGDSELAAYNELLAELARRDRAAPGRQAASDRQPAREENHD